jgi:3-deoxy-D-manno-octulosonic acid kinase
MAVHKTVEQVTIVYYASVQEPAPFLRALADAPVIPGAGRGGIKIIEVGGRKLVARKYAHGGLFRMFTGDLFLDRRRAVEEAEVMNYLREKDFPVVTPFCVVAEKRAFAFRLHLVTVLEEGAVDLLRQLGISPRRQRLRIAKQFAEALRRLEQAGVFHPDLHLRNVLLTPEGKLVFLDFDRARRKAIGRRDMESMFRRLGRFVDKMEREGQFSATGLEKALFLRTYARLSGTDLTQRLARSTRRAGLRHRVGWFIESLLYGKR